MKGKKILIISILTIILVIGSVLAWHIEQNQEEVTETEEGMEEQIDKDAEEEEVEEPKEEPIEKEERDHIGEWKVYKNEDYNYQVSYPADWTIDTHVSENNFIIEGSEIYTTEDGEKKELEYGILKRIIDAPYKLKAHEIFYLHSIQERIEQEREGEGSYYYDRFYDLKEEIIQGRLEEEITDEDKYILGLSCSTESLEINEKNVWRCHTVGNGGPHRSIYVFNYLDNLITFSTDISRSVYSEEEVDIKIEKIKEIIKTFQGYEEDEFKQEEELATEEEAEKDEGDIKEEEDQEVEEKIDEVVSWKLYVSKENEVKFKHPEDAEIRESEQPFRIQILHPGEEWFEPSRLVISNTPSRDNGDREYEEKDIFEGGKEVERIQFIKEDKIIYADCVDYKDIGIIDFCNNVLSTFEFSDQAKLEKDKQEEIEKFTLNPNATEINIEYGNFSGDGKRDAVVYYKLEDVIIDERGTQATKQYLETYLWSEEEERYHRVRQDEGLVGRGLAIAGFKIVDFNEDGKEEIFVLKMYAGSGMHKSYYVMGYKDGTMVDIPIEKEVTKEYWREAYGKNTEHINIDLYGRENILVENNALKRQVEVFLEGDANCCPTGPRIEIEFKLEEGGFVIDDAKAVFNDFYMSDFVLNLPMGWIEVEESEFDYQYKDNEGNYFAINTSPAEMGIASDMIWRYRVTEEGKVKVTEKNPRCEPGYLCLAGDGKFTLVILPDDNYDGEVYSDFIIFAGNKNREDVNSEKFERILEGLIVKE